MPGLQAMRGARARSRVRTRRGRLCSWLARSAPSAGATANAAPAAAAACARRSLSGRAAAPVLSTARLFSPFFPFLGGGGAERSRGRGGAGRRRRRPRTRGRRRREASCSPARLPALPNLSLSETGSRIGSQRLHYGLHQAL